MGSRWAFPALATESYSYGDWNGLRLGVPYRISVCTVVLHYCLDGLENTSVFGMINSNNIKASRYFKGSDLD